MVVKHLSESAFRKEMASLEDNFIYIPSNSGPHSLNVKLAVKTHLGEVLHLGNFRK